MSVFYGTVQGQRGPATRCGSLSSGIIAAAQSWDGSVVVKLSYRGTCRDSDLMVDISLSTGSSPCGTNAWYGTFNEFMLLLDCATEAKRNQ